MPLLAATLQLSAIISNFKASPAEKAASLLLHESLMRSACSCALKEVLSATELRRVHALSRVRRWRLKTKTIHQAPAVIFSVSCTACPFFDAFPAAALPSLDIANCAAFSKLCDRVKLKNQSSQPVLLPACFPLAVHAAI